MFSLSNILRSVTDKQSLTIVKSNKKIYTVEGCYLLQKLNLLNKLKKSKSIYRKYFRFFRSKYIVFPCVSSRLKCFT